MRVWTVLVLVAGCRQVFGLEGPQRRPDASHGAPPDVAIDAFVPDAAPCATDAGTLASMVQLTANAGATVLVVSNISVAGSQTPTATPGQALAYQVHYMLTDTACSGDCLDQIEIGFVPGHRSACPFDGTVPRTTGASGMISAMLTAPTAPGGYDIRVNIGQNFSCNYNGATDWWGGSVPPASATIAQLCVVP